MKYMPIIANPLVHLHLDLWAGAGIEIRQSYAFFFFATPLIVCHGATNAVLTHLLPVPASWVQSKRNFKQL